MLEKLNQITKPESRVLMVSLRNFKLHVCRSGPYELEDIISACDNVDVIAPVFNANLFKLTNRLANDTAKLLGNAKIIKSLLNYKYQVEKQYELFFFFCQSPQDLLILNSIKGWREKCRYAVCWVDEIWVQDVEKWSVQLELLKDFDHIFMNLRHSVNPIKKITQRPCHFLTYAVDAAKFYPHSSNWERCIDVYSIGRRSQVTHQALLELGKNSQFLYVYDTIQGLYMANYQEHRSLYSNLVKRSHYMIVNKAKFDLQAQANPQEEVGPRFFEAAAGGAVMLGSPPKCETFTDFFDWEDAVIEIPFDCSNIADIINDLNAQPERLARIRRESVVSSLLRNDWIYRWEEILKTIGIDTTPQIQKRKAYLENLVCNISRI
jgi:Glycosyl transferases group 1